MHGHALGGAGGIEGVATVMAVHDDIMPPTINYEFPIPNARSITSPTSLARRRCGSRCRTRSDSAATTASSFSASPRVNVSGEAHRRRLRALLRLAAVRAAGDLEVVERAFVHESFAKERGGGSNERMEFLGDSVLASSPDLPGGSTNGMPGSPKGC